MKLTKALLIEMIKEEIEAVLDEQAVNENMKLDRYKANIANMTDDRASEVFQLLTKPESQQMTTIRGKERKLVLALLKLKLGIEISDDDRRSIKNAERTFSAYQGFKKRTGYKEPKFESIIDEQEKQADFSSHDAVKQAIEKEQIDVGNVFTFMLGNNVRKGVYAGKRKVAAKDMPEDVTSVFFINRSGDVTSMRKKDYGGDKPSEKPTDLLMKLMSKAGPNKK
jgi:hypothetical protein